MLLPKPRAYVSGKDFASSHFMKVSPEWKNTQEKTKNGEEQRLKSSIRKSDQTLAAESQ